MVTFPTFQVPNLGPPVADYASMIANIGQSFEGAYSRSRDRTLGEQFADQMKLYAQGQQQTAPGAVPSPNAAPAPAPGGGSAAAPGYPGPQPPKTPTFVQLQGGAPSADIQGLIDTTTATHQLAPGYLQRLVQVESRGDPNAFNSGSKASGLGQFIPSTWKRYGGGASPFDPGANLDATARLTKDNANYLRAKLGREPTSGELYLAHQQGPAGAVALLSNPDAPATSVTKRGNILANLPAGMRGNLDNLTAGQFASIWTSRFADLGGGGAAAAAPSGPPPGVSAQAAPAGAGSPSQAPAAGPAAGIAQGGNPIADAQAILANPRSPQPMRDYAVSVLQKAGVDPASTGSLGPPAAAAGVNPAAIGTGPAAAVGPADRWGGAPPPVVPPQNGPGPIALAGAPASLVGAPLPGGPATAMPPPAPQAVPPAPVPAAAPPLQPRAAPAPPAAAPVAAAAPAGAPPGQPPGIPIGPQFAGIPPNLLAAMARNPATAHIAAQMVAQRALTENKPITAELNGTLQQYDPRSGRWYQVAGQQKAQETVDVNSNRFQWNPQTLRYDIPVNPGGPSGFSIVGPNDADHRRALNIPPNDTRPYKLDPKGNPEPMNVDPTVFDREQKLRNDFDQQQRNKDFYTTRDQYQRLQTGLQDPTGAQDLAIVFSYMKMLDPTSTVREGEQASAASAAGVPAQVIAAYNNLVGGGKLSDEARNQMAVAARRIFVQQGSSYNRRVDQQHELAKQYQLTPTNIAQKADIPDLKEPIGVQRTGLPKPAPAPKPEPTAQPTPPPPPQKTGEAGSSQANPLPISSPADLRKAPSGSWVRYPGFRGQPKIEQVP